MQIGISFKNILTLTSINEEKNMRIPRLEIETGERNLHNKKIITDLNIIPHPCAIYISESQEIYLNAYAFELLGLKLDQNFDMGKFLVMNPHLQALLYKKDFSNIPVKVRSFQTSPLKVEVKKGSPNEFTFELKEG